MAGRFILRSSRNNKAGINAEKEYGGRRERRVRRRKRKKLTAVDAWLHIVHPCGPSSRSPPPPRGTGSTHRDASGVNRGRCAIYRKIFMGLAVGPCARVPITHNRRVTNVLLIASSRTETRRAGKNRESSSREKEGARKRQGGKEDEEGWKREREK